MEVSGELCQLMRYGDWQEADSMLQSLKSSDDLPKDDNHRHSIPNAHFACQEHFLHIAAEYAAPVYILDKLLDLVDVDFCCQPNDYGDTLLHLVCANGIDPATIRLLALKRPQDFMLPNLDDKSPCENLIDRIDSDLYETDVADIAVAVARVSPSALNYSKKATGESILHQAVAHSYSFQDFVLLRTLLNENGGLISALDENGATPMHFAARLSDECAPNRIEALIQNGGRHTLCLKDSNGHTPLHVACRLDSTNREKIEFLVAGDPSALQILDNDGMTPLESFRQSHRLFLTQVDYTNEDKWNEEEFAPIADSCVTLIVGTPLRCRDSPRVHDLLRNENCTMDIAKLLIYALRDQLCMRDATGNLPLHTVASLEIRNDDKAMYVKAVELLLKLHPKACRISNRASQLPLELMMRSNKSWDNGMKQVLLEHPAAILDVELNQYALCAVLEKLGKEMTRDALYELLNGAPALLQR